MNDGLGLAIVMTWLPISVVIVGLGILLLCKNADQWKAGEGEPCVAQ